MTEPAGPPRWFYLTLAACAVAVTVAVVYALVLARPHWVAASPAIQLNTRTGETCVMIGTGAPTLASGGSDSQPPDALDTWEAKYGKRPVQLPRFTTECYRPQPVAP